MFVAATTESGVIEQAKQLDRHLRQDVGCLRDSFTKPYSNAAGGWCVRLEYRLPRGVTSLDVGRYFAPVRMAKQARPYDRAVNATSRAESCGADGAPRLGVTRCKIVERSASQEAGEHRSGGNIASSSAGEAVGLDEIAQRQTLI